MRIEFSEIRTGFDIHCILIAVIFRFGLFRHDIHARFAHYLSPSLSTINPNLFFIWQEQNASSSGEYVFPSEGMSVGSNLDAMMSLPFEFRIKTKLFLSTCTRRCHKIACRKLTSTTHQVSTMRTPTSPSVKKATMRSDSPCSFKKFNASPVTKRKAPAAFMKSPQLSRKDRHMYLLECLDRAVESSQSMCLDDLPSPRSVVPPPPPPQEQEDATGSSACPDINMKSAIAPPPPPFAPRVEENPNEDGSFPVPRPVRRRAMRRNSFVIPKGMSLLGLTKSGGGGLMGATKEAQQAADSITSLASLCLTGSGMSKSSSTRW